MIHGQSGFKQFRMKAKTTEEFDRRVDAGEDIFDIADPVLVTRLGLESKRENVDLPDQREHESKHTPQNG